MSRVALSVFAVASVTLVSPPHAAAQTDPSQRPVSGQVGSSYSSEDLRAYAAAVVKVQEINKSYAPRRESAATFQQRLKVRAAATEESIEAINAEGITVETYNAISRAAEADPNFAERIERLIEEAQ